MNILDFSPQRSLLNFFNAKFPNYISSDYENQFFAKMKYDITNIDESDKSFELIICFHILEHILEDDKAITELYRVLKKNGILIIQVPLKPGKTYEDLNLTSKNELEAFGQEDHVRIYGQKSLEEKLKKFEFNVEIIDISKNFSETEKKFMVFQKNNF